MQVMAALRSGVHYSLEPLFRSGFRSPWRQSKPFRQKLEKHFDLRRPLPARGQQSPQWIAFLHLHVLQ